jgi:capsule polysaccharide export protein KpsE/RkpR
MRDAKLNTYTEDEIEAFVSGDSKVVNRLLLHSMNNLANVVSGHAEREEEIFANIGSPEIIAKRAQWIDSQIEQSRVRSDMMQKVATSTTAWALVAFIGFVLHAIWAAVVAMIKAKTGTP